MLSRCVTKYKNIYIYLFIYAYTQQSTILSNYNCYLVRGYLYTTVYNSE